MSLFARVIKKASAPGPEAAENAPIAVNGIRGPAREFPDGSGVRVAIDIDPYMVRDFHRTFPEVGMPVSLALLVEHDVPPAVTGIRRPVKEQVDGTLRVFIDISKEFRNQFFASFQHVGESVVLVAMRATAENPVPARGKLCRLAGEICRNYGFRVYVGHLVEGVFQPVDEAIAAEWLRAECGVESRKELDGDPDAAARFREIQAQFLDWARQNNMEAVIDG